MVMEDRHLCTILHATTSSKCQHQIRPEDLSASSLAPRERAEYPVQRAHLVVGRCGAREEAPQPLVLVVEPLVQQLLEGGGRCLAHGDYGARLGLATLRAEHIAKVVGARGEDAAVGMDARAAHICVRRARASRQTKEAPERALRVGC